MITYLGMTAPIALFSMITWLKNPYEGNKSEVEVKHLKLKEYYTYDNPDRYCNLCFLFYIGLF